MDSHIASNASNSILDAELNKKTPNTKSEDEPNKIQPRHIRNLSYVTREKDSTPNEVHYTIIIIEHESIIILHT